MINEAVSRAMDIIKLVASSDRPLTLTEICRQTGIPKTSAFGILHTLVEKSALEVADENTKSFKLGLGLFETTLSALSNTDLLRAARPLLEELNRLIRETVLFGVEDAGEMVFLDMIQGEAFLRATVKLGARINMHCSAIGKAVLAGLPEGKLLAFLNEATLARKTDHTIVTRVDLLKDVVGTKARGYSIDNEENMPNVICVGAPVYSRERKVIAGISVTMHAFDVNDDKLGYYGTLVHNTALKISRRMGFGEPDLFWDNEPGIAARTA
jgi:DNA-binding IclR family transcriptional regulator